MKKKLRVEDEFEAVTKEITKRGFVELTDDRLRFFDDQLRALAPNKVFASAASASSQAAPEYVPGLFSHVSDANFPRQTLKRIRALNEFLDKEHYFMSEYKFLVAKIYQNGKKKESHLREHLGSPFNERLHKLCSTQKILHDRYHCSKEDLAAAFLSPRFQVSTFEFLLQTSQGKTNMSRLMDMGFSVNNILSYSHRSDSKAALQLFVERKDSVDYVRRYWKELYEEMLYALTSCTPLKNLREAMETYDSRTVNNDEFSEYRCF